MYDCYSLLIMFYFHREILMGKNHDVIDLTKLITVKTISDNPEAQGSLVMYLVIVVVVVVDLHS